MKTEKLGSAGPELLAHLQQLAARHAQQQDRRIARPVGDVLDQIQEHRLGLLDVVELGNLGFVGRAFFQGFGEGELCLGGRAADDGVGLAPMAIRISPSGQ